MKVLHFVRKSSQFKASFISNQINSHIEFKPSLVFRTQANKNIDGGFADFDHSAYSYLDLSENETLLEKIRFKTTRTLSRRQQVLLFDFIKHQEIDICHFHYGTDCGIFYPAVKKIQIPIVVSFYGYDCSSFPEFMYGYGKQYLIKRVFRWARLIFAMSPDMKKDLVAAGCPEEKVLVHYYGTDVSRFLMKRDYESRMNVNILILASLVPQKGHIFLLEGIKKLVESGICNFCLRIVGTGELEEKLKLFVRNNNLQKYVFFTGALKYASKEMEAEYKKADIFIHPSVVAHNGDKEGIPGTIIEAMAAGLPVISTFHAGIPYIIESGETGILVNENELSGLVESLKNLIQNEKLREVIGLKGQSYAVKNLDLKQKEIELESAYKFALKSEV